MIEANVIGNLGNDPEIRTSEKGEFVTVSVASSRGKDEQPTWISVAATGYAAEDLKKCKKGDRISVCGRLVMKEGDKGTFVNLNGARLVLRLAKFEEAATPSPAKQTAPTTRPRTKAPEADDLDF